MWKELGGDKIAQEQGTKVIEKRKVSVETHNVPQQRNIEGRQVHYAWSDPILREFNMNSIILLDQPHIAFCIWSCKSAFCWLSI